MYNQVRRSKKIMHSFLDEEENQTVFREKKEKEAGEKETKKESLPPIKLQKRMQMNKQSKLFYSVIIATSLVVFVTSLIQLWYTSAFQSFLGILIGWFGFKFTEPQRWHSERLHINQWNLSVVLSVFIKSLHPRIFHWRKPLLYTITGLMTSTSFFSGSLVGLMFGFYILIGFVFYAAKEVDLYTTFSYWSSWLIISITLLVGLLDRYSIGLIGIAFLLYQIYERLSGIKLETPDTVFEEE